MGGSHKRGKYLTKVLQSNMYALVVTDAYCTPFDLLINGSKILGVLYERNYRLRGVELVYIH